MLQVVLPAGGARLLLGSKPLWAAIPLKQSLKGARCKGSRAAASALHLVAAKDESYGHPTILVADLVPVASSDRQLDFDKLKSQVCCLALVQMLLCRRVLPACQCVINGLHHSASFQLPVKTRWQSLVGLNDICGNAQ